jgi:hypothetical protein
MSTKENKPLNKNLASKVTTKLPSSITPPHSAAAPSPQTDAQALQQALLALHQKRSKTQTGYESIIGSLKQIVQELLQRNDFLIVERDTLLRENYELRKKNESLSNILDVKRRLGDSCAEQEAIF